jgi:hypothetical protein
MIPDDLPGISAEAYTAGIIIGIVICSLPPLLFKHQKQSKLW